MLKTIDIDLELQPIISGPPEAPLKLRQNAGSNDEITLRSWRDIWLKNTRENHKRFGPFKDNGVGALFNKETGRPVLVVGSGPSLKKNIGDIARFSHDHCVVSCLHNFHYMEDHGVHVDYYVSLDAGHVTIEEVSEGGSKDQGYYWDLTEKRKLVTFIGSPPELVEKWKGEIQWFHCSIPDEKLMEDIQNIEPFHTFLSTGGNVLGACTYLARAIMGANPVIFTGADFSFSYDKNFHGWNSKYDKHLGNAMRVRDIYGLPVYTWGSYWNFKNWTDYVCCQVPGLWINATEGGCLGAYETGNIFQIIQSTMKHVCNMYSVNEIIRDQCENPSKPLDREKPMALLF